MSAFAPLTPRLPGRHGLSPQPLPPDLPLTSPRPASREPAAFSSFGGDDAAGPGGASLGGVLVLTSRLGMGGAERHSVTLANGLSEHLPVGVAYLKPEEDLLPQLHTERLFAVCSLQAQTRMDERAMRDIAALVQAHGVAVIVAVNAYALMYALWARRHCARPPAVVQVFHTTRLQGLKAQLSMLFYRPWFWAAQHGVFVCDAQRRHWQHRGLWSRQVHTIHNGVDAEHFRPEPFEAAGLALRMSLGWKARDRVVGLCAVLRPEKAHALLLQAVAALHREGQDWRVLLIGDGPLREQVMAWVERLGLQRHVHLSGYQGDVRGHLAACDVLALPSTSETFSLAALEAMAMARPVLMSDVGGAREQVVPGRHGELFASGSVQGLADGLRRLWQPARSRALGAAARERVLREFSLNAMQARYLQLLQPLCRRVELADTSPRLDSPLPSHSCSDWTTRLSSPEPDLLVAVPPKADGMLQGLLHALSHQAGLRLAVGQWGELGLPGPSCGPSLPRPHWLEAAWKKVDRALFERRSDRLQPPQPESLKAAWPTLCALCRAHPGRPVLDLTGHLATDPGQGGCSGLQAPKDGRAPNADPDASPNAPGSALWETWQLEVEGQALHALPCAIRAKLGQAQGSLRLRLSWQGRTLAEAQAWLDHRSLARSEALALHKIPALVQAACSRWKQGVQAAVVAGPGAAACTALETPAGAAPPPATAGPASLTGTLQAWKRLLSSALQRLLWRDQWQVEVWKIDEAGRPQPVAHLRPPRHAFWADPFVLAGSSPSTASRSKRKSVAAWVFIEELHYDKPSRGGGKGRISVLELDAQGRHGPPRVCLDLPWHLSYPQVFEHQGQLFMLPESSAHETVDLYVCTHFPSHWRHVQTLLSGVRVADATVLFTHGRWWMWAAQAASGASLYDELHLYHAPALTGPWQPHALNPVKIDAGSARPAGALFFHQGRLIRPAQDCRNGYGSGVVFMEVNTLSPTDYSEGPAQLGDSPWGEPVHPNTHPNSPAHTINRQGDWQVLDRRHRVLRILAQRAANWGT